MFPIERRKKITEPRWKQSEEKMLLTLDAMSQPDNEWDSTNWAIWKIMKLNVEVQDCGIVIDRLEPVQDDLASWFEHCDLEDLNGKQVAQIIRKWRAE